VTSNWHKNNEEYSHVLANNTSSSSSSTGIVWDDIGGLETVKLQLKKSAEWPIKYRSSFERLGLTAPRGILMYGPPGCAKTTLVRALANSTNRTFIYLNSATVYSPYLGDAEKYIRQVFAQARMAQPSIIFMDEMDSLVGNRGIGGNNSGSGNDSGGIEKRILSTLLNEMDGIEISKDVLVIGATNRPDMLDAALLRPGRLDHLILVPPPDHTARLSIIKLYTRKHADKLDPSVIEWVAQHTNYYTGADLEALCQEAALEALRRNIEETSVQQNDFAKALQVVKPSLNEKTMQKYAEMAATSKKQ